VVLSEQDDRACARSINEAQAAGRPVVQLCDSCQLGDDASIADRPGEYEGAVSAKAPGETAEDAVEPILPSPSVPPATLHASQEPDRPLYEPAVRTAGSKPGGTHSSASVFSGNRTLSAGDLTRALLDLPISRVVEAITENATPTQIAAIREAVGGSDVAAPEAPAPETVAAGPKTIVEFEVAAVEALTPGQIAGLIGRLMKHLDARGLAGIEPFLADLKAKASA
jgi:hypothetical protein